MTEITNKYFKPNPQLERFLVLFEDMQNGTPGPGGKFIKPRRYNDF